MFKSPEKLYLIIKRISGVDFLSFIIYELLFILLRDIYGFINSISFSKIQESYKLSSALHENLFMNLNFTTMCELPIQNPVNSTNVYLFYRCLK